MLEEWKVRQRILNLGIDRRDVERWFHIFSDDFLRFSENSSRIQAFLDAGFKNPYLVYKVLNKCINPVDLSCFQKRIELYKGYKAEYMSLGLDELKAEKWAEIFDDKGKDYCKEGWKDPEVVLKFRNRFEEVNRIVEEFLVDGLSKEEVFFALENAGIWQKDKVDYEKLQSFREKHQTGQHPFLTSALLQTNKSFKELSSRLQFYTTLGFSFLSAQEWVAAELVYNRRLTKYEVLTWLSTGVDKGHIALKWLSCFPLDEAIKWYSVGLPQEEVERWKRHGFSPEMAGAFWKVRIENPKAVDLTVKEYGIEHFKELVPYFEKIAMDASGIWLWLRFDRGKHKMKDWLSLGVNYYSLAYSLENKGFTPEKVKTLLNYCSLEELLEEVQKGKSYREAYEHFYNRYLKKVASPIIKRFKR